MSDPTSPVAIAKPRDWMHLALMLAVAPSVGIFLVLAARLICEVAGLAWGGAASECAAVFACLVTFLVWLKMVQDSKVA